MQTKGVLVVVSGFSGAGKGTVMKALLEKYDNYALSVSATTRSPRPGEENGREYFFLTESQFEDMIRNDELIEHARYVDHYYGTPRKYVEDKMAAGKDVILEIEIQGALNIKKKFPDALLVFIVPPTAKDLKKTSDRTRNGKCGSNRETSPPCRGGVRWNGFLRLYRCQRRCGHLCGRPSQPDPFQPL